MWQRTEPGPSLILQEETFLFAYWCIKATEGFTTNFANISVHEHMIVKLWTKITPTLNRFCDRGTDSNWLNGDLG